MHSYFLESWDALPCSCVAMETSDKHCQTTINIEVSSDLGSPVLLTIQRPEDYTDAYQGMYDETVIVDAEEIESPSSDEEVLRDNMSKFNPPVRHTARHDFDSDSDSDSDDNGFLGRAQVQSPERKPPVSEKPVDLPTAVKETTGRSKPAVKRDDSSHSESESVDLEPGRSELLLGSGRKRPVGVVIPAEGAYDPKHYQDLKVPPEMENIFQYIMKYTPQKIDIDFKLQPFVPEYVPAVGDIDAFVKVTTPACNARASKISEQVLEHIDNLGLTVLDEPAAEQSDSALLYLQLRAISKTNSTKSTLLTKKVENAEKNPKAIERWIRDVSELHFSKPAPTVTYAKKMPDIDTLMEEWPDSMEQTLNEVGFPPPTLDCTLTQYLGLVCGLLDIPIHGDTLDDTIHAIHLLFSLYSAVRNNQLYAEREKEKADA